MTTKQFHEGFTLIELSLSMIFVGILSVAVVMIINDTVAAYRRGLTIGQVNTTGMDVVDDMRTAVVNSSSKSVTDYCYTYYKESSTSRADCLNDGAYNFIAWTKYSDIIEMNMGNGIIKRMEDVPIFGAFCTGTYSYIWNTGYYDVSEANLSGNWATLTYEVPKDAVGGYECPFGEKDEKNLYCVAGKEKPFRLLKIKDNYRGVCASVVRPGSEIDYGNIEYSKVDRLNKDFSMVGYGVVTEEPVDLILENKENDLALFNLTVARPAESSTRKNTFYSVSFILGTTTGGVDITAKGKSCETPENYEVGYFEYCAINRFNFAVQAGNKG